MPEFAHGQTFTAATSADDVDPVRGGTIFPHDPACRTPPRCVSSAGG